jgi:hypothetical protein
LIGLVVCSLFGLLVQCVCFDKVMHGVSVLLVP